MANLPVRVVSLACSNTEIVCALGCADLLVGVDDHSDYPKEVVDALPKVGPDLGIDVERVRALSPDLVLASLTVPGHEQVIANLEAAGLPYIAPEPTCLEDVFADILSVGARLGKQERARELVAAMRRDLVQDASPPRGNPRILVEWWPKPVIVPGRQSWVTELIELAGGVNPFGKRDVKSTPVVDAEVLAAKPDAVVISWCGVRPEKYRPDVVRRRSQWQGLPALTRDRIACIPEAFLGRPGPRLVDGLRALRQVVRSAADGPT